MSKIDFYFAAHSAFAYIGAARLYEIAENAGRKIAFKPMDLGKVVGAVLPEGFANRSAAHRNYYFGREIERWAEFREVAFKGGIPRNHSHDVTLANGVIIAAELADGDVAGLALGLMKAHWGEHADLADPEVLAKAITDTGMEAAPLLAQATQVETLDIYAQNTAQAMAIPAFGSPTFVLDGDVFYGQDRLEMLERALVKPFANTWRKI